MTLLKMVAYNVVDSRTKVVVDGGYMIEKRAQDAANKLVKKGVPAIVERTEA